MTATKPQQQDSQTLVERCAALREGSGAAIQWVSRVRANSQRLDRESDSLIDKLRRVRNLANRLGRAASRPVSIGFFGLSQAGKSYLISAMAASSQGELETDLGGRRLNFIQHVNPPGGGKEATGLVTRFTRQPTAAPASHPLQLSVFSEVDLAKVLGNAFFNDFDREQVDWDLSPAHLRRHLAALEPRRKPGPVAGVSEDDVVDLLEYFEQRFPKTTEKLKADFWPSAIPLAPRLDPNDRAALFSVLWGEVAELTEAYLQLRRGLVTLGHADMVYCPVTVLVEDAGDGTLSQANSIMNVDILERLGRDEGDTIEVIPSLGNDTRAPVSLPRSMLAALTTELRFVLADPPRVPLLETVDLLDFPGYRGRLAVADIGEVRKQLKDDQTDPVAQLILRGKVAYLFERYTDDQEMNVLTLCAPSHKQSDVKDLGPVLETWVRSTQGDKPEIRARRPAGLIWALTMFDFRLNPTPGQTEDLMRKGWEGMMKLALLERFGSYQWLHEWAPGRPFDNLFLVRKPRMAAAVIDTNDEQGELGILPAQEKRLGQLRETFCSDATVRRHLQAPEEAWDAMLKLNDGGISRLAAYLGDVAQPQTKLQRIAEQLDGLVEELVRHRFGPYYQEEGAAQVDAKRALAEKVIAALRQRPNRFAELLRTLQPPKEALRAMYLRSGSASAPARQPAHADNATEELTPAAPPPPDNGGLIDLDGLFNAPTPTQQPAADSSAPVPAFPADDAARGYVRDVLRFWVGHLKALPEDANRVRFLGLDRDRLEDLIGELITAADRLALEESLVGLISVHERQAGVKRAQRAERQVFVTAERIARFIDFLGCDQMPLDERPRSLADAKLPVFNPPSSIPAGTMPQLSEQPINFSAHYIVDWFAVFQTLAVANAGHTAGRDITAEQNADLGEILSLISGQRGMVDVDGAR